MLKDNFSSEINWISAIIKKFATINYFLKGDLK